MSEIRYDLSQFYSLKAVFEEILGQRTYRRIKDHASLSTWKTVCIKLVDSLAYSIDTTVTVSDAEWKEEAAYIAAETCRRIKKATSPDELFAGLSAGLARLSFHQVGLLPKGHRYQDTVPRTRANWCLDPIRSVQYVQNTDQKNRQKSLLKREATSAPSSNNETK